MVHFGFLFLAFVGGLAAGALIVRHLVKIAGRVQGAIEAGARAARF